MPKREPVAIPAEAPNRSCITERLDGAGQVVSAWDAPVKPGSGDMKRIIEPLLTSGTGPLRQVRPGSVQGTGAKSSPSSM